MNLRAEGAQMEQPELDPLDGLDEHTRAIIAQFPPLTVEQLGQLEAILFPGRGTWGSEAA